MEQTYWNDIYHGNAPFRITQPVVCKAGEGARFTDPQYANYIAQAARAGQPAFAYYALHTGTSAEVQMQARRAFSLIGRRPAMFDVEWWPAESGSPAGLISLPLTLIAIDTYRAMGGVMNVIYLPRSQWARMGSPSLAPLAVRGMHVINADYRTGSVTYGSRAWASYGGVPVWAVQYRAEHDTTPGSLADFLAAWTGGPVRPPQPLMYTVVRGDTLSSIAHTHGLTLAEIEALNPRAGHPPGHFDLIFPGDQIRVSR